jgi:hypothetical protein
MFVECWTTTEDGLGGLTALRKKAAAGDLDAARRVAKKEARNAAAAQAAADKKAAKQARKAEKQDGGPVVGTVSGPSPVSQPATSGAGITSSIGDFFGSIPPIYLIAGAGVLAFVLLRKKK